MPHRILPTVALAVIAFCFSDIASAADGGQSRYTPAPIQKTAAWSRYTAKIPSHATSWKQKTARRLAAGRDPYAD